MTTNTPGVPTGVQHALSRAAALLEGVARDSEHAVDHQVPLRCGVAANQLRAHGGTALTEPVSIPDDATLIANTIGQALALLTSLPELELSDPVLNAVIEARAAARAILTP